MGHPSGETNTDGDGGKEASPKKLRYPKAVFFIVGNEFCERFSYYGMKAILSIYFKSKLHFSEDTATVVYHTFSLFCYFTPIFGAWLADNFLGKYRTIIYISVIYILGHLLKTLAAVPTLGIPPAEISLFGLALIALGTGGIKPCVSAFGGDQFKLPEQERQLQTFFSVFYFAINSGSLISTFVTPILREDVHCFGDSTCYSLAFGIPAILMFVATLILIAGRSLYVFKPAQGNVTGQVCGTIFYSLKKKFGSSEKTEHWLDHAKSKYSAQMVEDVKTLLNVLWMYLPLPVFWALFDQQGSRWTFQATRMDGQIGSYVIKPDQMQLINPAFILILIPLFDGIVYPLCAKINFLVRPLQRIAVGGLLTASAFFISGILELELQKTYAVIPKHGEAQVHLMNTLGCPINYAVEQGSFSEQQLQARLNVILKDLSPGDMTLNVTVNNCSGINGTKSLSFNAEPGLVQGIYVQKDAGNGFDVVVLSSPESPEKSDNAFPKLRVIFEKTDLSANQSVKFRMKSDHDKVKEIRAVVNETFSQTESDYVVLEPGDYEAISEDGQVLGSYSLPQGGVYTFILTGSEKMTMQQFQLTKENSIHMLWIVPQYFVITVGEIMFSVTGLEFSYSQAPTSMKSVVQAAWLLTVAFGNLIVIIVAEAKAMEQASEFFMFGCLMVVDIMIFSFMAYRYKYVNTKSSGQAAEEGDVMLRDRHQD